MRGGPSRRMGFCCAIVLVSIAGCRQIVGFDEPSPPLPLVPFVPAPEFAETCTSCAAEKCGAQHQACVDDPQCRALLRCYGKCSNPLCMASCGSYDPSDYSWVRWNTGLRGAESALLTAYQKCVSVYECPADCGWGLDWGCLDERSQYHWPSQPYVDDSPIHVKLEVLLIDTGVSASVGAFFPTGTGMDVLVPTSETNAWGQVDLEFPTVTDPILQIKSTDGSFYEFRVLDYSGPFFRDTRLFRAVFPSDFHSVSPSDAEFAGLIIAVSDCIGAPAVGITFELEGANGHPYKYADTDNYFGTVGPTDRLGAGGFRDVRPDDGWSAAADKMVTVLAKRGKETVARRTVLLRANWLTSVVLRPLSGDD